MVFAIRSIGVGIVGLTLASAFSSCTAESAPEPDVASSSRSQAFASLAEIREAVSAVVGCETEPTTAPIVNPDLAGYTAEYAVCSNRVQVEWYDDSDARLDAAGVYSDASQPLAFVEGENWIVADLSFALGEPGSGKDLKKLAQELGGTYTDLNGFEQP
ncbi:hypothetical protein AAHB33_05580 [Paenarthrobacter sp. S56]|uniref:hypothetical protein n=1 Tax=Paenarthrobacter sp. S56 TaxID=3138179 RepID=UPI0032195E28